MIQTLEWTDKGVRFIDQTKLPTEEVYVTCKTHEQVADVIRNMVVRGAPAIGVAAAMGIALGVNNSKAESHGDLKRDFDQICDLIGKTRPTAVNLFWAIRRMQEKFERIRIRPIPQIKRDLIEEAQRMHAEDIAANQAMGRHGATLMPSEGGVLTHCNAGALATAGYGTALGVIRAAVEQGKKIHVYADETRPFLQGLAADRVGTDERRHSDDGHLRQHGRRDDEAGQDRGDRRGRRPHCGQRRRGQQDWNLYGRDPGQGTRHSVLCGRADFDRRPGLPRRQQDSHRAAQLPKKLRTSPGKQMVPDGVGVENPAFDVTPAKYVAAIITEKGIARAPYEESLRGLAGQEAEAHP